MQQKFYCYETLKGKHTFVPPPSTGSSFDWFISFKLSRLARIMLRILRISKCIISVSRIYQNSMILEFCYQHWLFIVLET